MKNELRFSGERMRYQSSRRSRIIELIRSVDFDLVDKKGNFPRVSVVKVGRSNEKGVYFLSVGNRKVNACLSGNGCIEGNDGRGRFVSYGPNEKTGKITYKFYYGTDEEMINFPG